MWARADSPSVQLRNVGLEWAEDMKVGLLGHTSQMDGLDDPCTELRQYVHEAEAGPEFRLGHSLPSQEDLEVGEVPFAPPSRVFLAPFTVPFTLPSGTYEWAGALYVLAKGAPPAWFQVTLPFMRSGGQHLRPGHEGQLDPPVPVVVATEEPRASFRLIQR